MTDQTQEPITLEMMRRCLYSAVVCDALDAMGLRNQSPRCQLRPLTIEGVLIGRCKTTLWADIAHVDPEPYKLELEAVDSCQPDDVLIAAASGTMRSGVWGELLSTAARRGGCIGVIVDGAVRDLVKMRQMRFPVYALGTCVYDSLNRQRVIDIDVSVEIGGVLFNPGDLVIADLDGMVVIPRAVEGQVIRQAWVKVHAENVTRDAIREGAKAREAYERFGVL